jgi:elongation factor Ts
MVSVDLIKQLREGTGAGIADCRGALEEAGGNLDKAANLLRKKGLEKASKKADRETHQGKVFSYVHGGRVGALVSLRCETDFVANTDDFVFLGKELCLQVSSMNPKDVEELLDQEYIRDPKIKICDLVKSTIAKLGENIKIGSVTRVTV